VLGATCLGLTEAFLQEVRQMETRLPAHVVEH
jgi:hypothetical protein